MELITFEFMSGPNAIKLTTHVRGPCSGSQRPTFLGSSHGEISTKKQKSHTPISMLAKRLYYQKRSK